MKNEYVSNTYVLEIIQFAIHLLNEHEIDMLDENPIKARVHLHAAVRELEYIKTLLQKDEY